jgi:glycosyltransferase involved in cell wall biosynthesis
MSSRRRLSICYAVPGHSLVATSGPTRNVLGLARALSQWASVTVAFQRVADAEAPDGVRLEEIEPGARVKATRGDDAAVRGLGYGEFLSYLRQLRRFAASHLLSYDIVLEKSWLLSGYLSSYCRRRGVLGVPVENLVPDPAHVARGNPTKFARLQIGRWLAGRYLRKAPLIIAETEFLKADIAANWRVAPERIAVVGLGVDRALFRPLDQAVARRGLGIAPDKTVLLYVGVLDDIHDLGPLLEAMSVGEDPTIELHIVGDGHYAGLYRQKAGGAANVVFHGRVAHARVP